MSTLPPARCRLPLKETRVILLVRLRIRRVSLYCLPLLRCSGRGGIQVNGSLPVLKVVPLVGLPRYVIQQTEPVLPVASLSHDLLYCGYSSWNPPALVLLGWPKERFFPFVICGDSDLRTTSLRVHKYENGYLWISIDGLGVLDVVRLSILAHFSSDSSLAERMNLA